MRPPYEATPLPFIDEDWKRIQLALRDYIIRQESGLKAANVGDREWNELNKFIAIERDINLFIFEGKE